MLLILVFTTDICGSDTVATVVVAFREIYLHTKEGMYIRVSFRRHEIPELVVMETGVVVANGKTGIVEKGGNRPTIV